MQLQPVAALTDNYVWLACSADQLAVVDPGEAAPVLAALDALDRAPTALLLTHHHPDHIGGVGAMLARWPQLPVYAPKDDRIPLATQRVDDGDRIEAGLPCPFEVIAVPGHTLSHVAFHAPTAAVLFSGDTLFSLGCGRLFEGTPAQMLASLTRLAALPLSTRVCCGHEYTMANLRFARSLLPVDPELAAYEPILAGLRAQRRPSLPSTLALELRLNPFLRVDQPALRNALQQQHGLAADADAVATFAALRQAKDHYK
jgi:hydroxyacylglutathione hydrolase